MINNTCALGKSRENSQGLHLPNGLRFSAPFFSNKNNVSRETLSSYIKILYLRFIVSAPSHHLQPSAVLQPAKMFSIKIGIASAKSCT